MSKYFCLGQHMLACLNLIQETVIILLTAKQEIIKN